MVRGSLVGVAMGLLGVAPVALLAHSGATWSALAEQLVAASAWAVAAVGFVVVPQALLAVLILGLALHRLAARGAGLAHAPVPGWLGPAVESALLLGMLGTIAGMVRGFSGLDPDAVRPGPLIHSLGAALRSSFVGFGLALVGVWLGPQTQAEDPTSTAAPTERGAG